MLPHQVVTLVVVFLGLLQSGLELGLVELLLKSVDKLVQGFLAAMPGGLELLFEQGLLQIQSRELMIQLVAGLLGFLQALPGLLERLFELAQLRGLGRGGGGRQAGHGLKADGAGAVGAKLSAQDFSLQFLLKGFEGGAYLVVFRLEALQMLF